MVFECCFKNNRCSLFDSIVFPGDPFASNRRETDFRRPEGLVVVVVAGGAAEHEAVHQHPGRRPLSGTSQR